MARNKKITKEKIYKAAVQIVDRKGLEYLTTQNLAEKLEVKAPSLYGHIKSLVELRREISAHANDKISETISTSIQKKSGDEAIKALASAYRGFAVKHRGLYHLSVVFPVKNSKVWVQSYLGLRDLFGNVLRDNYSLSEDEVRTLARTLRSLLHGYVSLEISGGWSNIVELEKSFDTSIGHFILSINSISSVKKSKTKNQRT